VRKYAGQLAAVILEPIRYNCGCLEAREKFLAAVREIYTREGIVLIFAEVICGLRMSPGSAQSRFGVIPDLTTAAKAIGGGLPIALVGGKAEIIWLSGWGVSTTRSGSRWWRRFVTACSGSRTWGWIT